MIQLSKRLSAVASFVLPGGPLADIGTDHALLPVALVQRGVVPSAVAGDVHPGPAQAAERQVRASNLESRISVRLGDGLRVLRPGEAATVAIAGMGGGTMVDILSAGGAALQGVRRLVLQPNIGERLVREWLASNGWKLAEETLLEEDGLMYEVLAADAADSPEEADRWNAALYDRPLPGLDRPSRSLRMLLGPYLSDRPTELFVRKWTAYAAKLETLIEQIGRSASPDAQRKREELAAERKALNEVLTWLSQSK